jgi:hypothetical protein
MHIYLNILNMLKNNTYMCILYPPRSAVRPGACDPLMNAYAMLLFDIAAVLDTCRQYICTRTTVTA